MHPTRPRPWKKPLPRKVRELASIAFSILICRYLMHWVLDIKSWVLLSRTSHFIITEHHQHINDITWLTHLYLKLSTGFTIIAPFNFWWVLVLIFFSSVNIQFYQTNWIFCKLLTIWIGALSLISRCTYTIMCHECM